MNIGKQIQLLRKQKGITQERLAAEMGVSVTAVSKWETSNSMPDIVMLCALADYFQVTTDELLCRNNKMQKVFICDDAIFIRETLFDIISEKGYKNIHLFENGKKLLANLEAEKPNAVFLDIHLPDGNGLEILQKIKKQNSEVVVIMVSADNREKTVNKASEYGAECFIPKPFLPEQIKQAIDKYLK